MQRSKLKSAKKWFDQKINLIASAVFVAILVLIAFDSVLEIPSSIYLAAISFLVLLVLDHVVGIEKQGRESGNKIYTDDMEALENLSEYIKLRPIKTVDAIEYSGITIENMIRGLMKTDCKIRLLLFDPRKTNDPMQRTRIRDSYFTKKASLKQKGRLQTFK